MKRSGLATTTPVRVALPGAMMGFMTNLPGIPEKEPDEPSGSNGISCMALVSVNGCGIFPAAAGTAWGFTAHICTHNKPPAPGA